MFIILLLSEKFVLVQRSLEMPGADIVYSYKLPVKKENGWHEKCCCLFVFSVRYSKP